MVAPLHGSWDELTGHYVDAYYGPEFRQTGKIVHRGEIVGYVVRNDVTSALLLEEGALREVRVEDLYDVGRAPEET